MALISLLTRNYASSLVSPSAHREPADACLTAVGGGTTGSSCQFPCQFRTQPCASVGTTLVFSGRAPSGHLDASCRAGQPISVPATVRLLTASLCITQAGKCSYPVTSVPKPELICRNYTCFSSKERLRN